MRAALLAGLLLLPLAAPVEARAPIPLAAEGFAWSPTNPLPGDLAIADLCGSTLATLHIGVYTQVLPVRILLDPDPCASGVEAFSFTVTNAGAGLEFEGRAAFTSVAGTSIDRFDAVVAGTYFGRVWVLQDTGSAA